MSFNFMAAVTVCSDFGAQEKKISSGKVKYSCLFKNFPPFVVIHTVKGFSIVNEAEVDVFLISWVLAM